MGIHKILFYPFIKLLLGMMVYYILIYSFFSNSGLTGLVIVDLAFNGLVYLLFFFVWCMIFRDIRNKFVNVFISKKRGGDE
ncbi:hypothetical protein DZI82_24665 [Escherichia coli]|nr:hypothetical protein [Escherichia coli]